jgi:tetratricopeptide (TPR) repeat protein
VHGITFILDPRLIPERWRTACYLAGGIAANAVAALLALACAAAQPRAAILWLTAAAVNALFAVLNLVPFSFRIAGATFRSDGAQILRALRGTDTSSPGDLFRTLRALSGLWRGVGDLRVLRSSTVHAAASWAERGDSAHALELLDEAGAIPAEMPPALQAYLMLTRGLALLAKSEVDAAATAVDEAEAEFRRLDHPAGSLLAAIARGDLLWERGDREAAAALYEAALTSPLVARLPALRALLHNQIRVYRCELPGGGGGEALLADYEATPARERSPSLDRYVYRKAGEVFGRAGRHERAAAAYARALEAVAALDEALDGPDRERFRLAQVPLIEEAKAGLRQVGRDEDAALLDNCFQDRAARERQQAEGREEAKRRLDRILPYGLALTVLNVVVALAVPRWYFPAPGAQTTGRPTSHNPLLTDTAIAVATVWGLVTLCTGIALAVGLPLLLLGYWLPNCRRLAAGLFLSLGVFGWCLGGLLFALAVLLRH